MIGLKFEQNICILYLVDHVGEVYILDLNNVTLLLQNIINNRCQDASVAAGTEKVGLGDWKSARPTWALASTAARAVVLGDWEEVSLAD
jgi:hypothetical protein